MARFAASTRVGADQTRTEIERTLSRYGATAFGYISKPGVAIIGFEADHRHIKIKVPLPPGDDEKSKQQARQRWRAMLLVIKAKLESVESGIETLEEAFYANIVMPDGKTIIWPMFRDPNGYGRIGHEGKLWWSHTLMCTLAHGPVPSEGHEATHSCGKGKDGCVNPRHLFWGTRSRNQLDRRFHGTKALGGYRAPDRKKLCAQDVQEIRALKGYLTQREIAAMFGVSDATIRDIYSGKSWYNVPAAAVA